MYLHIDPESKQKECPWYARGFCKHGKWLQRLFL
jgi:cleavage and polyadenylation specificity factor subunit 4